MGLTIGDLISVLYSTNPATEGSSMSKAPSWPADAYGLCSYLLEASGTYDYVLRPEWLSTVDLTQWQKTVRETGDHWLALQEIEEVPDLIQQCWDTVWENRTIELINLPNLVYANSEAGDTKKDEAKTNSEVVKALVKIALIADETHSVLNLPELKNAEKYISRIRSVFETCSIADAKQTIDEFVNECNKNLKFNSTNFLASSTMGRNLEASMVRVLPKKKSPEVGISLRSITQNIGIWTKNEVLPRWIEIGPSKLTGKVNSALNVLLVPWPNEVRPSQFRAIESDCDMPDDFRFFDYEIDTEPSEMKTELGPVVVEKPLEITNHVKSLLAKAKQSIGEIDVVIFPELSINETSFDALAEYLRKEDVALIAGLGDLDQDENANCPLESANQVRMQIPGLDFPIIQSKHHRWKLERSQIVQYGLGSILDVEKSWWENTRVARRTLNFVQLHQRFVMSTIVCEDLARQDPVAGLLRAVGPNLIVALLMDGPQMATRWPNRYATVLADDPSSSVLTLTSIGMAKLSCPPSVKSPSRSIGLWKDPTGDPVEINLDATADAVVLCLSMNKATFYTADGRESRFKANTPVFAGIHQINK